MWTYRYFICDREIAGEKKDCFSLCNSPHKKVNSRCTKCLNGKNIAIEGFLYVINVLYQSEFQSYGHTWFVIFHVNLTLCDYGSWLASFCKPSVSSHVMLEL